MEMMMDEKQETSAVVGKKDIIQMIMTGNMTDEKSPYESNSPNKKDVNLPSVSNKLKVISSKSTPRN